MKYDRNMFDIQITEGASAGNVRSARAARRRTAGPTGDERRPRGSHKYSYFTATTELNNNTLH